MAESGRYRRPGLLERAATVLGRIPEGPLRRALRAGFRRLLARRPLECALPGGERLRILPEYRFVTWNPAEYAAFRAAVGPGAVVLDVGANVGAYTLLFACWGAEVHAFEPSAEARAALEAHLALNGAPAAVHPQAVADRVGRERLAGEGVHGTSRLSASGSRTVPTTTLDAFCAGAGLRPTVIKVDVEGAELRVLRGARAVLSADPPPALFVELHPALVDRAAFEAELAGQGLRMEALRPGADPWALEGECVRLVRG